MTAGTKGEECEGYDSGQCVQEECGSMTEGSMYQREVWRVCTGEEQWAVCTGEECGRYDSGHYV